MCPQPIFRSRQRVAYVREAQKVDDEEDAQYGSDRRGDELPVELAFRESRLKKIQEAKAELEAWFHEVEAAHWANPAQSRRTMAMPAS